MVVLKRVVALHGVLGVDGDGSVQRHVRSSRRHGVHVSHVLGRVPRSVLRHLLLLGLLLSVVEEAEAGQEDDNNNRNNNSGSNSALADSSTAVLLARLQRVLRRKSGDGGDAVVLAHDSPNNRSRLGADVLGLGIRSSEGCNVDEEVAAVVGPRSLNLQGVVTLSVGEGLSLEHKIVSAGRQRSQNQLDLSNVITSPVRGVPGDPVGLTGNEFGTVMRRAEGVAGELLVVLGKTVSPASKNGRSVSRLRVVGRGGRRGRDGLGGLVLLLLDGGSDSVRDTGVVQRVPWGGGTVVIGEGLAGNGDSVNDGGGHSLLMAVGHGLDPDVGSENSLVVSLLDSSRRRSNQRLGSSQSHCCEGKDIGELHCVLRRWEAIFLSGLRAVYITRLLGVIKLIIKKIR